MTTTTLTIGAGALAEYYDWFEAAEAGDRLVYYLGDLQYDRDPANHRVLSIEKRQEIDALNSLANRILADARENFLDLFQRKLDVSVYEYIAVLRQPPGSAKLPRGVHEHAAA